MTPITINEAGVRKLLQNIKPHKAAGPDNIPARILREAANNLAPAMTILFQASIDQGTLPDDWKTANVAPIFKKGDRCKAANYRPVSLTCISCKLMEHMISSSMMRHLDDNGILTDTQHGFRKHRSCESQLISTIHDLAKGIEDRKQTDVVLLDFSKAFDKVPHLRLLQKLDHYGIRGDTRRWIAQFIQGRDQKVLLNGQHSTPQWLKGRKMSETGLNSTEMWPPHNTCNMCTTFRVKLSQFVLPGVINSMLSNELNYSLQLISLRWFVKVIITLLLFLLFYN